MSILGLSRWQFGITTAYHFLFVPLTIGLVLFIAGFQTAWFRTGLKLTRFYGRLFLINFAVGVVTGIVQEFQFGMNCLLPLKTMDSIRIRARALATRTALATGLLAAGFLSWTIASYGNIASAAVAGLAAAALVVGVRAIRAVREGVAFAGTALAIAAATAALFVALYADVLPFPISSTYSLTTANASVTAGTLAIMTVAAVIFLPWCCFTRAGRTGCSAGGSGSRTSPSRRLP